MDTCVYGHIFRESVMVRNRASVAMKIQALEPQHRAACIQVQKPRQIEGELQPGPLILNGFYNFRTSEVNLDLNEYI